MRIDNADVAEMMGGPFKVMSPSVGEFHAGGGLTFTRTERHGIMVRLWENRTKAEHTYDGWYFRVLTFLDDKTWESVTKYIRAQEPAPECTCPPGWGIATRIPNPTCPQHGRKET